MSGAPAVTSSARLAPIDWMRGFVMLLMTTDHASGVFNAGHLMTDSTFMYKPGDPLPTAQFFARWVTHLCAPTFVFLAGSALALSVEKRVQAGEAPGSIDRFIASRGLFIALCDPLWMSWVFVPGKVIFQVMYAIGLSMIAMVGLRRLSERTLLMAGLVLVVGGEALAGLALWLGGWEPTLPGALLITGGRFGTLLVAYPVLPWLAMMMLGWSFGRFARKSDPAAIERTLWRVGVGCLALFGVVRGLNGYGNMQLYREGSSVVQWLHVSKYPPSLSFTTLELGIMALALAGLFRARRASASAWAGVLLVFGQTALFFYLLHAHLLKLGGWLLGLVEKGGLPAMYLSSLAVLIVLYPLCVVYGRYKRAHPTGIVRYV